MASLVGVPAGVLLGTVKMLTGHTPTMGCLGLRSEDVIKGFMCCTFFQGGRN